MILDEYRAQMISINSAIQAIESGAQEYRIGNRSLKRADLSALYRERRKIQDDIARLEGGGGSTYVACFYRD